LKQYEYRLVLLDRVELHEGKTAFQQLNELGSEGWHVVHIRENPMDNRDLTFIFEREKSAPHASD
jgi:hypothetical protein